MPNVPQVRRIVSSDETIGMGYASGTGLAVGTALEGFAITKNEAAPGQKVFSSITIVNSHEELLDELGMSFEAQGRYGFFQASAKADFTDSTQFNSTSTFIVAKCIVRNPFLRGKNFAVTQAAQKLLDTNRFEEFGRAFGDSFVRGQQTGGEFYTVIRITSISTTTQTELSLALQAEYNGLVAAGEFKGRFTTANSKTSSRSEFQAIMYQEAGEGPTIAPITKVEELIPRFRDFPTIAKASAAAYETEVATYDTLPLPLPTAEEQENFEFALRDTRDQKLRFIQVRNDLTFALRNPQFFGALPAPELLQAAIAAYTRLVNAAMAHASELAEGRIDPPATFDPGAVNPPLAEPAPIALPRAVPTAAAPSVTVPSFIGIDSSIIDETLQASHFGSLEEVIAGTIFTGEDNIASPPPLSRDVVAFIFAARRGTGPGLRMEGVNPDFMTTVSTVSAQFPAAGEKIAADDTLILQFTVRVVA